MVYVSSRVLRACVLLAVAGACAKPPETTPTPATSPSGTIITDGQVVAAPGPRNRDVITREEINGASMGSQNVLEVVKALRPTFLTVRGAHSLGDSQIGAVHASIDGNRVVSLDELRSLQASTIAEIRFLNPSAAMQKFGGSALEGPVILVKTM
ncbi:hypothetical protein BH11GEM1_BH11GEM1_00030 [soil metagenome]